jgi:hypothetical protein
MVPAAPPSAPVRVPTRDPAEALTAALGVLVDRMEATAATVGGMLEEARAHAGQDIASRVAAELPRTVDRLLARRQRRFQMVTIAVSVVIASAVALGFGYWSLPPTTFCEDTVKGGAVLWCLGDPREGEVMRCYRRDADNYSGRS